jgi:membrane associated rhomboid family serine protease
MFRNIPIVTKSLLIINVVVFFLEMFMNSGDPERSSLADWGALHFFLASDFNPIQFITYQFLHGGLWHLFGNMFALWMFGCMIEEAWGTKRFLIFYIVCGIGAGLCQEIVQFVQFYYMAISQFPQAGFHEVITILLNSNLNGACTIGASGAVFGVLLAFGMTFPNERLFIFPIPIPIKAKWFVIGYAAIELFSVWSSSNDGVAHVAHLGGMLLGLLAILYWRTHPGSDARFSINRGQEFFNNMKRNFEQRQQSKRPDMHATRTGTKEDDMEYNARKRERQAEIDAILDKIRKSGYDSLTKEEKKKLFDASKEN